MCIFGYSHDVFRGLMPPGYYRNNGGKVAVQWGGKGFQLFLSCHVRNAVKGLPPVTTAALTSSGGILKCSNT